MFSPPIPLIRMRHIIRRLRKCGAVSPETATTLAEAGVINPTLFAPVTKRLVARNILVAVGDGKYYLARPR